MLTWLSIIGVIIGIYGIVTKAIPLGIIFVISLAVFLYVLFIMLSKHWEVTDLGIGIFIVSLLLLIYTVCYLFLDIDVRATLGL